MVISMLSPLVATKNATVIWTVNGKAHIVQECTDKPYGICRHYVKEHKHDPRFVGGILGVISMRNL